MADIFWRPRRIPVAPLGGVVVILHLFSGRVSLWAGFRGKKVDESSIMNVDPQPAPGYRVLLLLLLVVVRLLFAS